VLTRKFLAKKCCTFFQKSKIMKKLILISVMMVFSITCFAQNNDEINLKDSSGKTTLYKAADNGDLEGVKRLLNNGAEPNIATQGRLTPLGVASFRNFINIVNLLLEKGANVDQITGSQGATPTFVAADMGHVEVLKALLTKKPDLDMSINGGATPLNIASQKGHKEIVELLLENGADVNLALTSGGTPLYAASQNGYSDIVKILLANQADPKLAYGDLQATPMFVASQNGHNNVVKELISGGADINVKNKEGNTPLMMATQTGQVEIVKTLLDNGADPNLQRVNNGHVTTPLGIAKVQSVFGDEKYVKIKKLLIQAGAKY
jgi:ankyrin repeat protein